MVASKNKKVMKYTYTERMYHSLPNLFFLPTHLSSRRPGLSFADSEGAQEARDPSRIPAGAKYVATLCRLSLLF